MFKPLPNESNKLVITKGCFECPCCDMLDMTNGFKCNLVDEQKLGYIKQDKWHMPITPDWCPLLKSALIIVYEPEK